MNDDAPDLPALKWTLRDIRAQRQNLVEAKPHHIRELLNRGLLETLDDRHVITKAGLALIEPAKRTQDENY